MSSALRFSFLEATVPVNTTSDPLTFMSISDASMM
jgi:hypothetical protein